MTTRMLCLVTLCLHLIHPNEAARILGVFHIAAPSHYILGNALMRGLAEAGHDVMIISPFTDKNPPKGGKWREIILDGFIEDLKKQLEEINMFKMGNQNPFLGTIFFMNIMGLAQTERMLNNTNVQKLIKSNEKFDIVIVSQFVNDAIKAFASHFNGHLVLFSNVAANSWLNHLVGNPTLPSFHPETILSLPGNMSFFQRLLNTVYKFYYVINMYAYYYPKQNGLIQKYFPNPVDINIALYNISLVLLNSHVSLSHPQPSVPCMIQIGGFHIKPPKKLPSDLQEFLDEAKEGVIYFSMGSNLRSKDLPEDKRKAILKCFGKRKEKVLWKWEDDVLPGQPSNVKLGKWLPQQDILAHPNVKVFVTHGGFLSTTETVYHGVPIVAIPVYGDQKMNANSAKEAGYGLILPYEDLSEDKLSSVLDEVLTNPKYRDNAKERSRILADRQVKPLDTAIYWVEYVLRHNGAKHLRVPYLDLTWYQFYLMDVLGFISVALFITCILLRKIFSYLCHKKGSKINQKKKINHILNYVKNDFYNE